jgi:leucyl/phenylalanyl-tRNA--protein transferase
MYFLNNSDHFPSPENCPPDEPIALGVGLTPEKVVNAYRQGIFPWEARNEWVFWWSPDPRMVLDVNDFKISRSLSKTLKHKVFEVRRDTAFEQVIRACATALRKNQPRPRDTWITKPFIETYSELYRRGIAHSVESWQDEQLVGGLYGLYLDNMFFGESMFALKPDASKVALAHLVAWMRDEGVRYIDCQQETPHLASLGANPVSRAQFLKWLRNSQQT